MEGSSPLAALQPKTLSPSFGMGPYARPKGSRSFVHKLGLNKPIREKPQFDLEALIDSPSPTTELVSDISQNFHIDKTPKISPRRSLFTSFTFERAEKLSVPMPSSPSPAAVNGGDSEDMDYLPLPHKAIAYIDTPESPMISPTTELPEDRMLCSSPPPDVPAPRTEVVPVKVPEAPKKPSFLERKKSTTLSRQPFRIKSGNIFKERSALTLGSRSKSSALELEQLFACGSPQPIKEKKLGPAFQPSPTLAIPKLTFNENSSMSPTIKHTFSSSSSIEGSPIAPPQRRTGSTSRPKPKMRRTMSMYDNIEKAGSKGTITPVPKLAPIADSPANRSPGEQHCLPCHNVKDDPLRRIKKSVLADILDKKYTDHYDEYIVVDCRFDYEYQGGHVEGAINIYTTEALEKEFFTEPRTGTTLVIFHCEFSACRAPRMAMHFRNLDRQMNMHRYPALSYPDVYILEGGYSGFFSEFKTRCEPQEYVEMDHASHREVREREMGKLRRSSKLGRAQTYHFGTHKNDHSGGLSGNIGKRSLSYNDTKPPLRSKLFESRRLASC
ncbi:hypothetical protein EV426DRAFT_701170 [Tirmania nivea]|nr:hypothetical protein EV426DRAFT_701170 [Tirmania nivea]